jgi:hypothetical protein
LSDNPFHDAVNTPPREQVTRHVEPAKPFFHYAIEQDKRRIQAQNMTRQQMFDNGFITVQDLDDEELRYGKCRDSNGRIPKRPNKTEMVPRDLYDEMVLEHQKRTDEKLRQQLDTMLEVMIEVATDDTVEPRDRMDAAKYLFERVAGKTAERVAITVDKAPWEEVFAGVAKLTRQQSIAAREGTIDAEVVEPDVRYGPSDGVVPDGQSDGRPGPREQPMATPTIPPEHIMAQQGSGPFDPAPPVPDHTSPVSTSATMPAIPPLVPTNAEQIRKTQEAQANYAARKKATRKRIQDAKKRRAIQRATGANKVANTTIEADTSNDKLTFTVDTDPG